MSDNRNMTNAGSGGPPEGAGYDTPGRDETIRSTSPAVGSPGETSEQRLTTPQPVIRSINETPGDANPALKETEAAEKGEMTTAELLLARETAEEEFSRSAPASEYQDQNMENPGFNATDSGEPSFPYKYQEEATAKSMDSPDLQESFIGATGGVGALDLRGRAERVEERAGADTQYTDAMAGEGPYGAKAQELDYSGPETPVPGPPSDLDEIAPDMRNIPDGS